MKDQTTGKVLLDGKLENGLYKCDPIGISMTINLFSVPNSVLSPSSTHNYHHIITVVKLLAHASLPLHFRDDLFSMTIYLINRMPTPILQNISPYEKLHH